jgi:hypothetical protein
MTHHGEPSHSSPSSSTHASSYASPGRQSAVFQVGAGLGFAGFSLGLLIFLAACFGFGAALYLSPLPMLMGVVGFALTIIGGVRDPHSEGPSVAASLFICVGAIAGGLLELAAWQHWRIFG